MFLFSFVIMYISDIDGDRLYWTDDKAGFIRSSLLNGSDIKLILNTGYSNYLYGLDVNGDFIYYALDKQVLRINKTGESDQEVIISTPDQVYAVLVIDQQGELLRYINFLLSYLLKRQSFVKYY